MWERGSTARDGVVAGLLGAGAVALWMVLVDAVRGRPLSTPALLGRALMGGLAPARADGLAAPTVAYLTLHVALFAAIAVGLAFLVHRADRQPSLLVGASFGFVLFQFLLIGLVALLAESRLGATAWVQFAGGNVIAALVTAASLYRSHPAVRDRFAHAAEDEP